MVNTFLVHPDFAVSASKLSDRHIFKQLVEAKQIIECLEAGERGEKKGFSNHPATNQWRGYIPCLKSYFNVHLREVEKRNADKKEKEGKVKWNHQFKLYEIPEVYDVPEFVGDLRYIYSHRAILSIKDVESYGSLEFPEEYRYKGYYWPSKGQFIPLAAYLQDNRRCPALMKSGAKKGKECGNILKTKGVDYCGVHNK